MIRVSTYLNFMGDTEEAFLFYGSVFGTDLLGPIMRMVTCRANQAWRHCPLKRRTW